MQTITISRVVFFVLDYYAPFSKIIAERIFYFMEKKDLFGTLVPQQIGNYKFKNEALLKQAFTRRSYTEENGGENNEVLEFIGDKALDIAVVRYLVRKYGNAPTKDDLNKMRWTGEKYDYEFSSSLDEGELTIVKQRLVQKDTLARRIDELSIADYLIMGKGDVLNNREQDKSVKEDLFEAIIGAVAIDSNWDFEIIQDVVEVMLNPDSILATDAEIDYVRLIYEWDESYGNKPWFQYEEHGESSTWYFRRENTIYQSCNLIGSEEQRYLSNTTRTCFVKIATDIPAFAGFGYSKNEARRNACKLAYEYLESHNMLFTIRDEIDEPTVEMAINQLEILARRDYIAMPEYEYREEHDADGNPIWFVTCKVEGFDFIASINSSSKKQAKKQVAFEMLNYVLENYEEE
jgi:ribonuclease-3